MTAGCCWLSALVGIVVIDSVIDSVLMKVKSKEVGKDDFTYNESLSSRSEANGPAL
jgi:hypothetical protein